LSVVVSFSLSLASLLIPAAILLPLPGVSGGVVIRTPVTLPELAAAILGTLPPMRGGLFMIDACVATEDVEFDLVGDEGRALANEVVGGGDGAANELAEPLCW
jgi:predicted ABC-type sugar transport system permease subunit